MGPGETIHWCGRLKLPGSQAVDDAGRERHREPLHPALGNDYVHDRRGHRRRGLEKGPGHYPATALPGQIGNFAVAGHRVGKGEPFLNLDQLRRATRWSFETKSQLVRLPGDGCTAATGEPPDAGSRRRSRSARSSIRATSRSSIRCRIIPGETRPRPLMTMTTCHPKFTANKRMIVHAMLARGRRS